MTNMVLTIVEPL